MVLVEIGAGGAKGIGYSCTDRAAGVLVAEKLVDVLQGATRWRHVPAGTPWST